MDNTEHTRVRDIIIERAPALWAEVMFHDPDGIELPHLIEEAGSSSIYGGERQLAMFAAIRIIRIQVHEKNMGSLAYGNGTEFHLLYSHIRGERGEANHYYYYLGRAEVNADSQASAGSRFRDYKRKQQKSGMVP